MRRSEIPIGRTAALAAALLLAGCGGRETGLVRFDPTPSDPGERSHQVLYNASCRSGAECVVTFYGPEGRSREIFGSRWSRQFRASPGQPLYLGVTVRQRCMGNYLLGTLQCDRAAGFARVTISVDGERVAHEATFHRPRSLVPQASFGVSTRHVIASDTAPPDSLPPDTASASGASPAPESVSDLAGTDRPARSVLRTRVREG